MEHNSGYCELIKLALGTPMLLGQFTIPFTNINPISIAINRLFASLVLPQGKDWLIVGLILLIYSAIALPIGFRSGFLHLSFSPINWINQLGIALKVAIFPALTEELVFRVLLLPHPLEVVDWMKWGLWAAMMVLLFILYHPVNAKTFFPSGFPTFFHPIFLGLAGLLGIGCTVTYALTGSLWTIVLIHWLVVLVWLLGLGGLGRLKGSGKELHL